MQQRDFELPANEIENLGDLIGPYPRIRSNKIPE